MQNPLEIITQYLKEKVDKVNVNNPKANSGAVLLKLYKDFDKDADKLVTLAFQSIQFWFRRDSSSSPAGTASLTNISTIIGGLISRLIKRDPPGLPWNMKVRLGDLFIEAFYNCGYIDIYYPKIRDSSYTISATNKWLELGDIPEMLMKMSILYTHNKPIKDIKSMDNNGESLIKDKPLDTEIDINTSWVRSANKLQQTGWRINNRVYDAILDNKDLLLESESPFLNDDRLGSLSINESRTEKQIKADEDFLRLKEAQRFSREVAWRFITNKAKALKDSDVFYQEVDFDYRGRVYYKEPFLNYQGCDLARGLFKFARGKPMTQEGLFWLAVHTASSFNMSFNKEEIPEIFEADYKSHLESEGLETISLDKMTLEDRVRWVNATMEDIIEYGKHNTISEDAEKPITFLACCLEWYDYSLAEKDNRIYMSHLPIPIDGSNNGWQHLGAISKDYHTGKLVGLVPVEIQNDFYVQTAKELVKLTKDERLMNILIDMPMKHIRKGISKRGSMTRAYSAGASKIADNMYYDCRSLGFDIKYNITQDDCIKFSKLLIKAINNVCSGPLDTMTYLQSLAKFEIGEFKKFDSEGNLAGTKYTNLVNEFRELYKKKDKTDEDLEELNALSKRVQSHTSKCVYGNGKDRITWDTPSGFPVEYTNFIMATKKCRGTISGYKTAAGGAKTINHVARVPTKSPDVRGFMCGISPNFIHSMDASHMAILIDEWNGDFGAVHDSFSTHACDIEDLLQLTKDIFIRMYNVENFYDYIEDQIITNKDELDVPQPDRGSLNIMEIQDSDYFFA